MLQLEGECYSIVELETSLEKETSIHVELGNFMFFPIWFRIVLYINRLFVINEKNTILPSIISDYKNNSTKNYVQHTYINTTFIVS